MKPFDLEAFKKGHKALTRDGRVASFIGICEQCHASNRLIAHLQGYDTVFIYFANGIYLYDGKKEYSAYDLVSMVSRHQHIIDSYDPEDTWQVRLFDRRINDDFETVYSKPSFDETFEYRLHPHNDLIKEWKKGAKIEAYIVGDWVEEPNPDWYEDTQYRIKPEQKTKTVYEYLYKIEADRYQLHPYLMDEEEAKVNFGKYAYKKTGRSWDVEV